MKINIKTKYLLAALLLAPLASLPAGFTASLLFEYMSETQHFSGFQYLFQRGITFGLAGIYYSYPLTWLYGLPMLLILRYCNYERLWLIIILSLIPAYFMSGESIGGRPDPFPIIASFVIWVSSACWIVAVWLPKFRSNKQFNADSDANASPPVN